jgi:uncharacterized damage-inducible protein DinB
MPYDRRPAATEYASFYAGYVAHVPDGDIVARLATQIGQTRALVEGLSEEQAGFAYGPGKWSVRTVLAHVTDSERILSCRALRFARHDSTPLPGFDENAYAAAARADERSLAAIAAEMAAVRAATIALFDSLSADDWVRGGRANNADTTVRALAWIIAGHELHHRRILETLYLPAM